MLLSALHGVPSKPRPGVHLRGQPCGMDVPCRFSAGKGHCLRVDGAVGCAAPADVLAVWCSEALGCVCRAPEDQFKRCRRRRDILMRIRPFSQPCRIKNGWLPSAGEQHERAPSCVGTGGHPSAPGCVVPNFLWAGRVRFSPRPGGEKADAKKKKRVCIPST